MVIKYFESITEECICEECVSLLIDRFDLPWIVLGCMDEKVVIDLSKECAAGEGSAVIECETDEDLIIAGKLEEGGCGITKIVNGKTYIAIYSMA